MFQRYSYTVSDKHSIMILTTHINRQPLAECRITAL